MITIKQLTDATMEEVHETFSNAFAEIMLNLSI